MSTQAVESLCRSGFHDHEQDEDRKLGGGLLTVAEVAEVLRVSTMTIYRLIKGGDITASGEVRVADVNG
ncbi:MAG: helix-turn-helix domain-containing protein [Nitriliruptoraceae bacterium]